MRSLVYAMLHALPWAMAPRAPHEQLSNGPGEGQLRQWAEDGADVRTLGARTPKRHPLVRQVTDATDPMYLAHPLAKVVRSQADARFYGWLRGDFRSVLHRDPTVPGSLAARMRLYCSPSTPMLLFCWTAEYTRP